MENRLKELREKYNLTQEELGAKVGVSRQTIISIEKSKYSPSLILAYKLSQVLGLSIEALFLLNEMEEKK